MSLQDKKLSQFDGSEVLRSAHQDENQAIRVTNANTSVPPGYSRVEITYNAQGSVTNAKFYDGELAEIRRITTVADVAGSLNNSYFTLYSEYDRARYHVWYNVSGTGTAPVIVGSAAIEVPIETNDSAEMVAVATQIVLSRFPDFKISRNNPLLTIENSTRGIATDTTDGGTGFSFVLYQDGTDKLIKSVDVPYDGITKYIYNTQERRFEVMASSTTEADIDGGKTPAIINLSMVTANTEYMFTLPAGTKRFLMKDRKGDVLVRYAFVVGETVSGPYIEMKMGNSYEEALLNITTSLNVYVNANKANRVLEVIYWT